VDNLVLLTFEEAGAHEEADLADVEGSHPQYFSRVAAALSRIQHDLGCAC
jgi:hypothetical protein